MRKYASMKTNYQSPGSICWAAFLMMGERLENSPGKGSDRRSGLLILLDFKSKEFDRYERYFYCRHTTVGIVS